MVDTKCVENERYNKCNEYRRNLTTGKEVKISSFNKDYCNEDMENPFFQSSFNEIYFIIFSYRSSNGFQQNIKNKINIRNH